MGLAASVVRKNDDCYCNTLLDYNLCLNNCVAFELNEKFIESKIDELDEIQNSGFIYQLTQARITELTLICAANYADNFEFSAAGDLLVNPRSIRIHIDGVREPVNKKRHLALTDQFNAVAKTQTGIIRWLGNNTQPEITRKPLLPDLYERLKSAGIISVKYLDSVYRRMNKIADVIGFLSAYHLSDSQMFYKKLHSANAESDFIRSNLCNFNCDIFFGLGHEILRLIENDDYKSVFIYAFEYDSVAKQRNLKYISLPAKINLSSAEFESFYAQAKVSIKGAKPGETITLSGEPILYAVTIPKNFPNQQMAIEWVEFLLSDKGAAAMESTGQSAIRPAVASDKNKLPEVLKKYVK